MSGIRKGISEDAADSFAGSVIIHEQIGLFVLDLLAECLQLLGIQGSEGTEDFDFFIQHPSQLAAVVLAFNNDVYRNDGSPHKLGFLYSVNLTAFSMQNSKRPALSGKPLSEL